VLLYHLLHSFNYYLSAWIGSDAVLMHFQLAAWLARRMHPLGTVVPVSYLTVQYRVHVHIPGHGMPHALLPGSGQLVCLLQIVKSNHLYESNIRRLAML
jgi:hypothetical protein